MCRRFAVARVPALRSGCASAEALLGSARLRSCLRLALVSCLSFLLESAAPFPSRARLQTSHGLPYASLGYPEMRVATLPSQAIFSSRCRAWWVGSSRARVPAVALPGPSGRLILIFLFHLPPVVAVHQLKPTACGRRPFTPGRAPPSPSSFRPPFNRR